MPSCRRGRSYFGPMQRIVATRIKIVYMISLLFCIMSCLLHHHDPRIYLFLFVLALHYVCHAAGRQYSYKDILVFISMYKRSLRSCPERVAQKRTFCFAIGNLLFSSGRGPFLACSAAGHAGGAGGCTLYVHTSFGPRLASVARALWAFTSRGELALFARSLSVEPESSRSMETPNCPGFHLFTVWFGSAAVFWRTTVAALEG